MSLHNGLKLAGLLVLCAAVVSCVTGVALEDAGTTALAVVGIFVGLILAVAGRLVEQERRERVAVMTRELEDRDR